METGFCLGSNLDDRLMALQRARDALVETPGARLAGQSPVYETEPVGVKPEHQSLSFLNAVVILESDLAAGEWLHVAQRIERTLGRIRTADRFGPRTIDIDILFSGEYCIESGLLIVPHPRWAERRFVLQPLADVRPDLVIPDSDRAVRAILTELPAGEAVTLFADANAW